MSAEPYEHPARQERLHDILAAYLQAVDAGEAPDRQRLFDDNPELAESLRAFFADHDRMKQAAAPLASTVAPAIAPCEPSIPVSPLVTVRYFGDYQLLEEIARGGMGIVYRARQVSLNRMVALKMILAGQLASPQDVQRFYAEAQIAANLQHPSIVAIHEVGQHEGQHYFSMSLVEGKSLDALIRDNTLTAQQAARYVKIVAEAIQFAHEQGTLHRDLKPSNILIDAFDQPLVTDFGLARRTQVDARLTATGAVLDTPSYMPPEQASGQRGNIGPASDVYSLGAMLYELVTGRPPFRAATPIDTILLVLNMPPVAPRLLNPKIDRNLETIILKCMAKEPGERYASARLLAEDLQAFLEDRPIKAKRAGWLERGRRWLRKHRRTIGLTGATAAATALLMVGLAWLQYQHEGSESEPTGNILLTTDGELLTAEALDDEDKPIAKRFTVPTAEPQTMPAGSYSFRFTAPGRCSETYRAFIGPQDNAQGHVTLEERRLGEPIPVGQNETAKIVNFGARADMVLFGPEGVRRIDVASGKLVWNQAFDAKNDELAVQFHKFRQDRSRKLLGDTRLVQSTADLDGDGIPDLVWAKRTGYVIYDGFPQKLTEDAREPNGIEIRFANGFMPGFGDLDGDGVKDVVFWAIAADLRREVRALSGVDGRLLWSQALDSAQEDKSLREKRLRSTTDNMVATVGDLDGDGKLEVIVQRRDRDQQNKESCEILVLEGRDGKPRWNRRLPAKPYTTDEPTPLVLSGLGGVRIAVLTVDPKSRDQAQIVMLDHTGKECGRAPVAISGIPDDPRGRTGYGWKAWIRPLSRDGLLAIGSGKLSLMQVGLENPRWIWPIPGGSGAMVDTLAANKDKPETIVVQAGREVFGLDSGNGKTLWTCRGPGPCTHALSAAEGLPRLLFRVGDNTVCLRAIPK